MWLSIAVRVVPNVFCEPAINDSSCARVSAKVCIGLIASCRASTRSGAVSCNPRVASSSADTVDGASGSVATMASSSFRMWVS
ncbi:hypothetical protein C1Y40_03780 [Mycobacterium talmoniae]|uniref:Uncharacterized protein n=1 Tax=Mycobacterium talmoniae TaxID=1858794 RepID=A0A2S8BHC7_9MYCO|nr:hypothetical protein C1Y40_03780 [Mycobacterium talmoniae]